MSEIEVANLVTKLSMEDTGVETSMAALGRQMKAVQSEFQAASSKLGEHANSQEGLKLKADALSRQMDIQAQKILQLKRKHEEAVAAKGRDARETQNLERQLNRAVTEYNRMHHELQSTNSEIEKQAAAWDKISNKLEASARKLESVGTAMTKVGASLSMLITAPLAAAGGAALKASVDYETAFTGVVKTVDASKEKLAEFKQEIRDMSKEIPAAATSIAKVAESAGQLGIKNEALMGFTRTMTDMGVATNMASDEAATALARLANITQMPQKNFDRLGSTVVALGNNLATTESEIVEMGLRLAGAGHQIGLTEAQTLSFAGALSSVGIEAEAGGSAFSRVMIDMAMAAQTGGKSLDNFALVAGMTSAQFKETFQRDASQALIAFVEGLGRMSKAGENTFLMLDKLGLSEIRVRDVIGAETPAGAQAKANQAENNAKGHANWLVGDLGQLQTSNKSNAVGAINEVFQSGVDAKSRVVAELNAKKIPATMNDPWATLASKIGQIRTDIKMATDGGVAEKTLDVNNLNFEPIIVYVRMGLSGQGEGYWITSSQGLLFVKDNSSLSQEYGEVKAYIRMEHYLNGSARVTWKSNGFSLDASVSGSHDIQNFGISRWCAFGI